MGFLWSGFLTECPVLTESDEWWPDMPPKAKDHSHTVFESLSEDFASLPPNVLQLPFTGTAGCQCVHYRVRKVLVIHSLLISQYSSELYAKQVYVVAVSASCLASCPYKVPRITRAFFTYTHWQLLSVGGRVNS